MCQPYIFIDIEHSRDSLQVEDWLQRASLAWYVECEDTSGGAGLAVFLNKLPTLG